MREGFKKCPKFGTSMNLVSPYVAGFFLIILCGKTNYLDEKFGLNNYVFLYPFHKKLSKSLNEDNNNFFVSTSKTRHGHLLCFLGDLVLVQCKWAK